MHNENRANGLLFLDSAASYTTEGLQGGYAQLFGSIPMLAKDSDISMT